MAKLLTPALRRFGWTLPATGLLLLAACATPPPPQPAPPKPQPPAPLPAPTPPPVAANWEDWPYTPGNWSYAREGNGSIARFGLAGQAPVFTMRCDATARRIYLARPGYLDVGKSANMVLRASNGGGQYPLANAGGTPPYVAATLAASDPMLDRMAFSRGKIGVEVAGAPQPLVIPNWAEISRVIEDCR